MTINLQAQQFNFLWSKQQLSPNVEILDSPHFIDFKLDYSLQSLERVDLYLDTWRDKTSPTDQQIIETQMLMNTLHSLAFYCAEVIGRTKNCLPLWTKAKHSILCHYPTDSHQVGVFDIVGILATRLLNNEGSIVTASDWMINLNYRQEDKYSQPLPDIQVSHDREYLEKLEHLTLKQRQSLYTSMPENLIQPLLGLESNYFEQTSILLEQGYFVRGACVQAHDDLFRPQYVHGRLAEVIYDPTGRLTYDDLIVITDWLFDLKGKTELPEQVQFIADYLKAQNQRLFNFDISDIVNFPLKLSSIFVDQNHLPDGMLSYNNLPLIICPTKTNYVTILPYFFWSDTLKSTWLAESQQRLGHIHLIDDIKKRSEKQNEEKQYIEKQQEQKLIQSLAKSGIEFIPSEATKPVIPVKKHKKKVKEEEPFSWFKFIFGWVFWIIVIILFFILLF